MSLLLAINRPSRLPRWLLKGGILLVVFLLVTYPRVDLLGRHVSHLSAPQSMVDPDAPALQPLRDALAAELPPEADRQPRDVLKLVQKFVVERVPYAWDWDTWGVADYLPTVSEVLRQGREDCDGRAVVAASLLQGLGFDARLVADVQHVWVWTPHGETMAPGGPKVFVPREGGGQEFNPASLYSLPAGAAYSVAVFPIVRELILLLTVWALALNPAASHTSRLLALLLLLEGLLIVRLAAHNPYRPLHWGSWLGAAHLLAGLLILWVKPHWKLIRAV